MMKKIIFLAAILLPVVACNQTPKSSEKAEATVSKKELQREIKELEVRLIKAEDANKDRPAAEQLIEKSRLYAQTFPKDSLSASYLFKAADVARGIGEYGKAILFWGDVWRHFKDYRRAPDALFLQGFTFDTNLQDKQRAKKYYSDFLKRYPNHPLAVQVKQLLAVVDKPVEELVKEFQKKNR
jgi:tetratricopeptide (TPR) repeat protein